MAVGKRPNGDQMQLDTLRYAKAATWIGVAGIVVAIAIAVIGYIWPAK
jgi:hypothetical protein